MVFDIQRMCVHDGPGIRTVVFLKGCPLRCAWCHNPEGMDPRPQLLYHAAACVQCGKCAEVCPEGVHRFDAETGHRLDRSRCRACFACVDACCTGALTRTGRDMTVAEVMAEALRQLGDKASDIQPILVSIDPARDTPQVLADYVANFGPQFVGLTGTPDQVKAMADAYRVFYAKVENKDDP